MNKFKVGDILKVVVEGTYDALAYNQIHVVLKTQGMNCFTQIQHKSLHSNDLGWVEGWFEKIGEVDTELERIIYGIKENEK